MKYNWQQVDWPNFSYDLAQIQGLLLDCTQLLSLNAGSFKERTQYIKQDSIIHFMVLEAMKSSAIEGEILLEEDIASSIKSRFGIQKSKNNTDLRAIGISQVLVDSYQSFAQVLTKKQLNHWHSMLLQHMAQSTMALGRYRTHPEAMRVVSGAIGKEKVHFTAPPSLQVNEEMQRFIKWFNTTAPGKANEIKGAALRSAITHLYFESIHPYEDANGRLGRVLAEKALYQSLGYPVLISLSHEIESNKKLYYQQLELAQQSNEITNWIIYFLEITIAASKTAEKQVEFLVKKSLFSKQFQEQANARQTKVLDRMLKEGRKGFEGGITASKYQKISKCSKATATRDLQDLLNKNFIQKRKAAGRSTSYELNL